MGTTNQIYCQKCNYSVNLREGIGFMYGDLRNVVSSLRKNYRSQILEIIEKNNLSYSCGKNTIYEFRMYRSVKTGEFYSRFYVKVFIDDESSPIYETMYRCPKSQTILEKVTAEDVPNYNCPKCNKKKQTISEFILWD